MLQKSTVKHTNSRHIDNGQYKATYIILTIAFITGFLFRLRMYLQERSFWLDTANLANNVVEKNYAALWELLDRGQSAPVGFLFVSKFIGTIFDFSELSLLLLPFMFGIGSLVLFLYFSMDVLGTKVAPLAFLPFSFCSTAIYYSGEFKQYSGDLFFSVLILLVAHRILVTAYEKSWIIIFGIVGIISVWFSNSAIFMLAGTGIALFINNIRYNYSKNIILLSVTGLIIFLHFIALYFLQIRQAIPEIMFSYWQMGFAPVNPFSTKTFLWWYERTVRYASFPLGFQGYGVWLSLLALIIGIRALFVGKTNRALFQLLIFPIVLLVIFSILHIYPITTGKSDIYSRLVLFTIPVAFIFIAIGVKKFAELFPSPLPVAAIIGIFLIFNSINHMIPWPKYMKQEMKPLVAHLQKKISPNDLVYVDNEAIPAFKFYTRHEPILFIKGKTDKAAEFPQEVDELPRGKVIWIVVSHDYINKHEIIKKQFELRNASVRIKKFPGVCWLLLAVPHNMKN